MLNIFYLLQITTAKCGEINKKNFLRFCLIISIKNILFWQVKVNSTDGALVNVIFRVYGKSRRLVGNTVCIFKRVLRQFRMDI